MDESTDESNDSVELIGIEKPSDSVEVIEIGGSNDDSVELIGIKKPINSVELIELEESNDSVEFIEINESNKKEESNKKFKSNKKDENNNNERDENGVPLRLKNSESTKKAQQRISNFLIKNGLPGDTIKIYAPWTDKKFQEVTDRKEPKPKSCAHKLKKEWFPVFGTGTDDLHIINCDYCDKIIKTTLLKMHLKIKHPEVPIPNEDEDGTEKEQEIELSSENQTKKRGRNAKQSAPPSASTNTQQNQSNSTKNTSNSKQDIAQSFKNQTNKRGINVNELLTTKTTATTQSKNVLSKKPSEIQQKSKGKRKYYEDDDEDYEDYADYQDKTYGIKTKKIKFDDMRKKLNTRSVTKTSKKAIENRKDDKSKKSIETIALSKKSKSNDFKKVDYIKPPQKEMKSVNPIKIPKLKVKVANKFPNNQDQIINKRNEKSAKADDHLFKRQADRIDNNLFKTPTKSNDDHLFKRPADPPIGGLFGRKTRSMNSTSTTTLSELTPIKNRGNIGILRPSSSLKQILSNSSHITSMNNNIASTSFSETVAVASSLSPAEIPQVSQAKIPAKDRTYDPNQHCGVKLSDSGKPCLRSLTCRNHRIALRREVPGRSKNFDELLNEYKIVNNIKDGPSPKKPVVSFKINDTINNENKIVPTNSENVVRKVVPTINEKNISKNDSTNKTKIIRTASGDIVKIVSNDYKKVLRKIAKKVDLKTSGKIVANQNKGKARKVPFESTKINRMEKEKIDNKNKKTPEKDILIMLNKEKQLIARLESKSKLNESQLKKFTGETLMLTPQNNNIQDIFDLPPKLQIKERIKVKRFLKRLLINDRIQNNTNNIIAVDWGRSRLPAIRKTIRKRNLHLTEEIRFMRTEQNPQTEQSTSNEMPNSKAANKNNDNQIKADIPKNLMANNNIISTSNNNIISTPSNNIKSTSNNELSNSEAENKISDDIMDDVISVKAILAEKLTKDEYASLEKRINSASNQTKQLVTKVEIPKTIHKPVIENNNSKISLNNNKISNIQSNVNKGHDENRENISKEFTSQPTKMLPKTLPNTINNDAIPSPSPSYCLKTTGPSYYKLDISKIYEKLNDNIIKRIKTMADKEQSEEFPVQHDSNQSKIYAEKKNKKPLIPIETAEPSYLQLMDRYLDERDFGCQVFEDHCNIITNFDVPTSHLDERTLIRRKRPAKKQSFSTKNKKQEQQSSISLINESQTSIQSTSNDNDDKSADVQSVASKIHRHVADIVPPVVANVVEVTNNNQFVVENDNKQSAKKQSSSINRKQKQQSFIRLDTKSQTSTLPANIRVVQLADVSPVTSRTEYLTDNNQFVTKDFASTSTSIQSLEDNNQFVAKNVAEDKQFAKKQTFSTNSKRKQQSFIRLDSETQTSSFPANIRIVQRDDISPVASKTESSKNDYRHVADTVPPVAANVVEVTNNNRFVVENDSKQSAKKQSSSISRKQKQQSFIRLDTKSQTSTLPDNIRVVQLADVSPVTSRTEYLTDNNQFVTKDASSTSTSIQPLKDNNQFVAKNVAEDKQTFSINNKQKQQSFIRLDSETQTSTFPANIRIVQCDDISPVASKTQISKNDNRHVADIVPPVVANVVEVTNNSQFVAENVASNKQFYSTNSEQKQQSFVKLIDKPQTSTPPINIDESQQKSSDDSFEAMNNLMNSNYINTLLNSNDLDTLSFDFSLFDKFDEEQEPQQQQPQQRQQQPQQQQQRLQQQQPQQQQRLQQQQPQQQQKHQQEIDSDKTPDDILDLLIDLEEAHKNKSKIINQSFNENKYASVPSVSYETQYIPNNTQFVGKGVSSISSNTQILPTNNPFVAKDVASNKRSAKRQSSSINSKRKQQSFIRSDSETQTATFPISVNANIPSVSTNIQMIENNNQFVVSNNPSASTNIQMVEDSNQFVVSNIPAANIQLVESSDNNQFVASNIPTANIQLLESSDNNQFVVSNIPTANIQIVESPDNNQLVVGEPASTNIQFLSESNQFVVGNVPTPSTNIQIVEDGNQFVSPVASNFQYVIENNQIASENYQPVSQNIQYVINNDNSSESFLLPGFYVLNPNGEAIFNLTPVNINESIVLSQQNDSIDQQQL